MLYVFDVLQHELIYYPKCIAEPGSLKDVTYDLGRSGAAEDTLPMDSSSDEEVGFSVPLSPKGF